MSQRYLIFTDVSADIDFKVITTESIMLIPMNYTLGEEDRCCDNMENEGVLKRFYDGQRNGDLTQTTQITPAKYVEHFGKHMEAGNNILYISLSGGLSSTFQSAMVAKAQLEEEYPAVKIEVVDSSAATGGMGLLVEAAARNRAEGMSLEDNAAWLEANKHRVRHWFMVGDLGYLRRGGRVSGATAVIGSALNIKPILKINADGTLSNFDKKRGAKPAIKSLIEFYTQTKAEDMQGADETIYLCHADAGENVEYAKDLLKEINPDVHIVEMMLCPIIGAHVGPGMLAIIHWGKDARD